jgi:hypothetical protein
MKYVMFQTEVEEEKINIPIIFPNNLVHSLAAKFFSFCLRAHGIVAEPISAGTVTIFGTDVNCTGESDTLKLTSRGTVDAQIIHNLDYSVGIEGNWMDEILAKAVKERRAK